MDKLKDKDKIKRLTDILEMIEIIVSKEKLDSAYHKDEVEKYYLQILQGKDVMNTYQRRDAGISDDKWEKALRELYIYIGIKQEGYDKELL